MTSPGGGDAGKAPSPTEYGDRAGEYLRMQRGKYRASIYVLLAFVGQAAILWGIAAAVLSPLQGRLPESISIAACLIVAVGGALWTFWDRWKVNEAFSSRYCSGLTNLTLLYLPAVSLIYANYRGVRKLAGR
jgi:hypothetical protein